MSRRGFIRAALLLPRQVKALLSGGLNRPRKGSDAGDHPPITPMRSASEAELGESDDGAQQPGDLPWGCTLTQFVPPLSGSDGWRLYEYITRHFIATVSQDCRYLQTTIDFLIGTEAFSCTGKTLISAGAST